MFACWRVCVCVCVRAFPAIVYCIMLALAHVFSTFGSPHFCYAFCPSPLVRLLPSRPFLPFSVPFIITMYYYLFMFLFICAVCFSRCYYCFLYLHYCVKCLLLFAFVFIVLSLIYVFLFINLYCFMCIY